MKVNMSQVSVNMETSKPTILYILIFCSAFLVVFTHSPLFIDLPHRDSGVFLYLGSQILNGDIPYKDIWDHKPPLIYYINALCLFITGGSQWGVWIIQSSLLAISSIFGFKLIHKQFGLKAATISIFLFLSGFSSIAFVNYTEEWALVFQISGLYVFWHAFNNKSRRMWFLFGLSLASSFLLKPNMIGIYIAIYVVVALYSFINNKKKELLINSLLIAVGTLSLVVPMVLYFYLNDSLVYLVDQVFTYNSVYTSVSLRDKIIALIGGFSVLGFISYILLIAWCSTVIELFVKKEKVNKNNIITYIALIGFPIEIYLSILSGRSYEHYYVPWLPIGLVLVGFWANRLIGYMDQNKIYLLNRVGFLILITGILSVPNLIHSVPNQLSILLNQGPFPQLEVTQFIKNETRADDYVLMWGAESSINFVSNRKSPTKYVYQYPLYTVGYQNEEMIDEFFDEIQTNQPKLIFDTSSSDPWIPPINRDKRVVWEASNDNPQYVPMKEMNKVYQYLDNNYVFSKTVGNWDVYVLK